jgi:cytochrome c553
MNELFRALLGTSAIAAFFALMIYPNLAYTGYDADNSRSCTGECYEEYVRVNGTTVDIERAKQALAAGDKFSDIRSLWTGCAACHGAQGQGGIGPMLAGQDADMIISKLSAYKNKETIGPQSAMMWGQAAMLTDGQIGTIGVYIQQGMPNE